MDNKFIAEVNEQILLFEKQKYKDLDISKENKSQIESCINNNVGLLNHLTLNTYRDILHLETASKEIFEIIKNVRDEVELKNFLRKKKNFDEDGLRKKYVSLNLKKKFPDFDIEKYLELINNPFLEVEFKGSKISFDSFIVSKLIIAINQMIFDEMDLYMLNIGKEGAGKSCYSSQQILYIHTFLKLVGIIKYGYEINKLFFTDIKSFLDQHENQDNNDYFRIEVMDEGNELNRSNFRDDENQQFKYEMRTERKMLRIVIINVQQIGELDTSISLSRVNFIFDCQMSNDKRTGTLVKGFGNFYIIPRGDFIYSPKFSKYFGRVEILNAFAQKLDKKKDYYTGLPSEFVIKEFTFDNKWGFDKDEYDKYVKDSMKKKKFEKGNKITLEQAFAFVSMYKSLKEDNNIKVSDNKRLYDVLHKLYKKYETFFELNPEKYLSIKKHYSEVVEVES